MKREQFVAAFLEGAKFAPVSNVLEQVVGQLYDERKIKQGLGEQIAIMDEVVADYGGLSVKCRRCGEDYELPCDLSEFNPDYSFCGKNEWCCP